MEEPNLVFYSGMLGDPFDLRGKQYVWEILGQWMGSKGSYVAKVKANSDNTLEDLASLITGDKNDGKLLGLVNEVKNGQIIEIGAFLSKIEQQLRDNIINAIDKLGVNFSTTSAVVDISIDPAKTLNRYFDGVTEKTENRDCDGASLLVYGKAVLDLLKDTIFDDLGYSDATFAGDKYKTKLTGSIKDVQKGDRAYFRNFDDYIAKFPNGGYIAENVIKYSEDKFWGHPGGILTEAEWYEELKRQYNAPDGKPVGKQRNERVPGFDGTIEFLNVPNIVKDAFLYRRAKKYKPIVTRRRR